MTTRREEQVSAQPDHAPLTLYALAPGAPADSWVPAFEQEWAAALVESRRTFSLGGLYTVLQELAGPTRSRPGRRRVRRLRLRRERGHRHGGAAAKAKARAKAPVSGQPCAVRFSAPAAKVLDTLPGHVEDTVWDVLGATAQTCGASGSGTRKTLRPRTCARRPSASSPSPAG